MQAVGEANMKYVTYFGHMFTQGVMLRNGPSIFKAKAIWISKQNIVQKKSFLEHISEVNYDLSM